PSADADFILWCNTRSSTWSSVFARVGLLESDATSFKTAAAVADTAYAAMLNARQAAKDATAAWAAAKKSARTLAAGDIRKIKTFALEQPNPSEVYSTAMIPGPKPRQDGVPPGRPFDATVALDTITGNLTLAFKCTNPAGTTGTVYVVQRRASAAAAWTQVGITSTRRFVDSSLVAGNSSVQYQITAVRGSLTGQPSGPITVTFGRAGDGAGAGITVSGAEFKGHPKLAA
ncbi:MAG: hypothetical protein MUE97_05085, partial [Phycisphaerales bacterium]|nr:hypothetical protein [Phycisphaerales bacterium]